MSIDAEFARMTYPSLQNSERERIEAGARVSGHVAGYTAGLRAATDEITRQQARREAEQAADALLDRQRVDREVSALIAAARALQERTVPLLEEMQDALALAAVDIAEAILGHELATGFGSARSALDRALTDVDSSVVHVVRMNPDDLAGLAGDARDAATVEFTADPTLSRGEAVTEFPDGYLDARISAAVARVRTVLLGEG